MARRIVTLLTGAALGLSAMLIAPALAQVPSPAIKAAVADAGRPAADTARDAARHPAEVVAFAGIKPGEKVAELSPGAGYFTRILAKVVGPTGHVYAITGARGAKGAQDLAAAYPNVSVIIQDGASFTLPEKVDLVWTSDNYHDFHNAAPPADINTLSKTVFDALKPGGIYLVEDYHAAAGAGATQTRTLHRIEEATVKSELAAIGFTADGESKALANPADDHTLAIFDKTLAGEADQFVVRFRKPK